MKIINKINWKNITIAVTILLIVWIIFIILYYNSQSKEDVIKSFVGKWEIYFTDKIPESYTLNKNKLTFTIIYDEKEINDYYKDNEIKPAGTHILKCQSNGTILFEVCGFDGLEISSCIAFGNFDLDKDKEILLVNYRDNINQISKYSVIDYTDGKIYIITVDDNTLVGKYIMQYFKSTYFIGFPETTYTSIFLYISIFVSIIFLIYVISSIIISIKKT